MEIINSFETRLIEEQEALEGKLDKLNKFNQGEEFDKLDKVARDLLVIQAGAMYTYSECLKARLTHL